ncbi:DUF5337 domain-containing protein [Pseudogemmobacter faecipullorum]|uniref:DUF5337 domain-containing protein n=1 Tax=Pseudogemmobacter faecipullorum TaxID=2755041 RepID=A0ABS8CKB9_9RHOB|nr:DUF5337 domain-containing protein [Pseudogemmobacter faecipullorum]MCB5409836.1 DUF5337 domain-containing protein [Pseudogemmobacter faecipullorum]
MSANKGKQKPADMRQARLAAFVIAGTMLLWILVQLIGAEMGWPPRYVFLADLAAIAAFVWALVVIWQIWRARRG